VTSGSKIIHILLLIRITIWINKIFKEFFSLLQFLYSDKNKNQCLRKVLKLWVFSRSFIFLTLYSVFHKTLHFFVVGLYIFAKD